MNRTRILFAALTIGILTGCSKDSGTPVDGDSGKKTSDEITLGVKQTILNTDIKTRGIGGIGSSDESANTWNGETLYIYAVSSESTDIVPTNEQAKAPTGNATGAIAWTGTDKHFYYGSSSINSFYGYHIDDAAGDTPLPTGNATDGFSIPFEIDGTQDLMVATTNKTADITSAGGDDLIGKEANLYSAWSARRNVVPNLIFKHLLSRLKFTVKAGNQTTVDASVSITKVEVYSKSKGNLVVVPSADGTTVTQGLSNVESLPEDLTTATPFKLMQAPTDGTTNLIDLLPVTATADPVPVGESMLVIPDDSYKMIVTTSQEINGVAQTGTITTTLEKPSKNGVVADSFVEGNVYTINIVVYGLEEIKVNATLTAWIDGGEITIDPDNEPDHTPAPTPQP